MSQGVNLRAVVKRWVDDPLSSVGFSRASRSRWVKPQSDEVVAMVEQFSERRRGVARFTLEWGFFSPQFARSVGYSSEPDLLHAPLRGRIGRLLGDGGFDVWWALHEDGSVTRESGAGHSERVAVETYSELEEAITQRLAPAVDTTPDTDALIRRAAEFVDRNILRSYYVDLGRVLDILRSPIPAHEAVTARPPVPPVELEWEPSRRRWLVTFADDVAHLRADLVEDCVDYCRQFAGVESVDWQDRELIVLRTRSLDSSRLQNELLARVESGLQEDEGSDREV